MRVPSSIILSLLAVASGVTAQETADGRDVHTGHKVVEVRETSASGSNVVVRREMRSQSFAVDVENGSMTIRVNGNVVPLDKVHTLPGARAVLDGFGTAAVGAGEPGLFTFDFAKPAAPPVMIGIHHGTPGPALERQLRLDPGTTTLVTAVVEGLPAFRAGIREYDVVTRIDGEAPAHPRRLMAAMASRGPGERMRLEIIQEGERKEVEVEIEPYNELTMARNRVIGAPSLMHERVLLDRQGMIFAVQDFAAHGLNRLPHLDVAWIKEHVPDLDGEMQLFHNIEVEDPRVLLQEVDRVFEHPFTGQDRMKHLDQRVAELEAMLEKLLGRPPAEPREAGEARDGDSTD